MKCLLCSESSYSFHEDDFRSYYQCSNCKLVFVPRTELISESAEKKRYEGHQVDAHYRTYLTEIRDEILPHVQMGPGLDFGCGHTTMLADLFHEKGIEVHSFDHYFRPDSELFQKKYQFIILSEVIEHLRDPLMIMNRLNQCLLPGGAFFIKTMFVPKDFENWFYKRDMTHIQFFNSESMGFLAKVLRKNVQFLPRDICLIANEVEIIG